MKTSFTRAALLAVALIPIVNVSGDDALFEGSSIDSETLVDQQQIIRIADTLDAAVDAKNWKLAGSLFTEQIDVDFTSLVGGEPATIPSTELIDGWAGNLKGDKSSFHMRSNHRATFTASDEATLLSNGYAWNMLDRGRDLKDGGNPLWEVWGTYTHGYKKVEGEWKIKSMTFNAVTQRGSIEVRDTPGKQ